MMKDKQTYVYIAAGICLLIFVSAFFNRALYSSLKGNPPLRKEGLKSDGTPGVSTEVAEVLSPVNPAKYAIHTQKESGKPLSQAQSDINMKKTLEQGRVLSYLEEENAFENIQLTEQEYKRRLDDINERIKYFEGLKRDAVRREEALRKLETLYRLKSTLTVLKDKIIIKK